MENTNNKDSLSDNANSGAAFHRDLSRPCKTIEELAAEQGVALPQDLDAMIGEGKGLWDSDEDFEEWLEGVYRRRREGR